MELCNQIFAGLFLLIGIRFSSEGCPHGWTRYGSSCFDLVDIPVDWLTANMHCMSHGGHLATLETPQDNVFMKNFLLSQHPHLDRWIGGTDELKEGHWVWVESDEALTYKDWYTGEPSPYVVNPEDCLRMTAGYKYSWADVPCYRNFSFICEIPSDLTTTPKYAVVG